MNRTSIYYRQAQLLVQILPIIAEEECFALKGGTAINLFEKDLPRLSVDIDLVYLPIQSRIDSLTEITSALTRISTRICKTWPDIKVVAAFHSKPDALRLIVFRDGVQVKIELSPVLRGTVYSPGLKSVCDKVENEFGFAEIQVVHYADLYAGKICAALDRQHPRDLFDILLLLQNNGFNTKLRKALIIYLISHQRPVAELLEPGIKDISTTYYSEFESMSSQPIESSILAETLTLLITTVNESFTRKEREFFLSFKQTTPDWSLLDLPDMEKLPAVAWKLHNLRKSLRKSIRQRYKNYNPYWPNTTTDGLKKLPFPHESSIFHLRSTPPPEHNRCASANSPVNFSISPSLPISRPRSSAAASEACRSRSPLFSS